MKRTTKIILAAVAIAAILLLSSEIWRNYSRRLLDLDMDMCDENGNVIHVTVDAVLHRKKGILWGFEGQIRYDGKVFTDWRYDPDRLVLGEYAASGKWGRPDEWLNGFLVADRKDGTYYFMTYQESVNGKVIDYFGPASTKEEAERINDIWVQVFRGN
ncbi:MAG: hypothetical protein K2P87_07525 [Lachnospiraceae bacterium]|nr:hypothetical protein [Lachnospiraceae bacterium]